MSTTLILGAGRFGLRAGKELIRKDPYTSVCIIDHDPAACRSARSQGFQAMQCDGIAYLSRMLTRVQDTDWVIPAIPVHVAYKWVENRLAHHFQLKKTPIPASLVATLPNPSKGPDHTIYTSIANFRCPEDCPMPGWDCTVTGKPRPCSVLEVLQQFSHPDIQMEVIRSSRLAPGVGGFPTRVLFQTLDRIGQFQKTVIIGTACTCHGVVDAFRITSSHVQTTA